MATNLGGRIITFYSYKGGVGRTMILANVAWILASNGRRVLVVDWDLEAPGLHRYFHPFLLDKSLHSTEGLIDFLTDFTDATLMSSAGTADDEENWHKPFANILDYAVSLDWKFPKKGTIDFVAAGKQGNLYTARVNSFNWERFYESGGGRFLEAVKEKMRGEYDYILIDSRTGISDISGICTVQLPDIVVAIFSANDQNILGSEGVITSVTKQWLADKSSYQNKRIIFPVLARTDDTEKDKLDSARNYIKAKFTHFIQHLPETEREAYWGNVEIPYIPWYAYEEVLAAFGDAPKQRKSLLAAIEQLASYLTKDSMELVAPSQLEREKTLSRFTRQFFTKPYAVFLLHHQEDSGAVEKIAAHLDKKTKLDIWFHQRNLNPAWSWEQNIKQGLRTSLTCIVFVGKNSKYLWQDHEIGTELQHQIKTRGLRAIPVLLPDVSKQPELPLFMTGSKWIEFREVIDEEALWRLEREIQGIGIPYESGKEHDRDSLSLNKYDIFVSYARVDNESLAGVKKGWVTTLVNGLENYLRQKSVNPDGYSFWMDYAPRGNESITPDIAKQLENSDILLVILSPGYLASSWCRGEINTFFAKIGKDSGRVFIVERNFVPRPEELKYLPGYKFWVEDDAGNARILATPQPNPKEFEYYQGLDNLARRINDKLKSLRETSMSAGLTIFLADVSDDLEELRDNVKHYIDQQGVQVLPEKNYSFANIEQLLDQDLSQCSLFVQLLSEKIGHGFPYFQYVRAQALNLPILQWRDNALDLNRVHDQTHRNLLSQPTVISSDLVEFQWELINRLESKNIIKEERIRRKPWVFINAVPEDMALARQIAKFLETQGFAYTLPAPALATTQPSEIQKDLENNLLYCDAVIMPYDNASVIQVRERLLFCQYMQAQREQPLKIIAVYVCPSTTDKQPLGIIFPNMLELECPAPQTDTCLPLFIQALQT